MEQPPRIDAVQLIGRTRLLVRFNNGERKVYDCAPLLSRPRFQLLTDPAFFRAVRVDAGGYGISWNYDIDLSEYELWTNGEPFAADTARMDALAKNVRFDDDTMWVDLADGCQLGIPLAYFPRLLNASASKRASYIISGGGIGIHWDDLDEDISVPSLLMGVGDRTR